MAADTAGTVADWVDGDPEPADRAEIGALTGAALAERFAATLRFGTAGLRGPVRAGPNGMNVAVVTRTTSGVADWLDAHGHRGATVVVGRDARHGSEAFATTTAEVLAARGFDVVALPHPAPTPLLAFACRDLGAAAGIQITASHNPPADNGYKVYLDGGAQLIPPADAEIEALIARVGPARTVPRSPVAPDDRGLAAADRYLARIADRFGAPAADLRIALTALHGVGGPLALDALRAAGFDDVVVVDEQFAPDPDFPTVGFPNPEEPGATDRLLALAASADADIAVALDPDADRCAVGTRVGTGSGARWRMLTGDETGALIGDHLLAAAATDSVDEPPVVASTLVSGSLLAAIAAAAGARHVRTLTGFKWLVRAGEPLLYAYEEAIGHCVDPAAVRDKDGISAAVVLAGIARDLKHRGSGLLDALDTLYARHGVHVTTARSVRVADIGRIASLMAGLRRSPPPTVAGIPVRLTDYAADPGPLRTDAVELSGADADGRTVRVLARPSGTEPKLKYYIEVAAPPAAGADLGTCRDLADAAAASLPE